MKFLSAICGALAATLALSACNDKGTLDNSRVEYIRLDGRGFEVRVASTNVANEYRLLVVRETIVIDPDPENERSRGRDAAKPFMERTCKDRPYKVLDERLVDSVNLYMRFRCEA